MEARYLRVKNWAELQPSPRRPWLNLAHDNLFFVTACAACNLRKRTAIWEPLPLGSIR